MFSYDKSQRLFIAMLLLPAFAVLALFYIWPSVFNFRVSFTDLSLLSLREGGDFIGLENYAELMKSDGFRRVIWNTVFWLTIVSVGIRLVFGLLLAILIESPAIRRFRLTTPLRLAMLLPWATPPIVAVVVWRQLLDGRTGFINEVLFDFGLIKQPIAFLADITWVWPALILIITWNTLPIVTLTLAAALQSVPKDLYEAAEMDGTNALQRFFHVTLPHLRPTLVIMGLLLTIWTFNNFVYVWLATGAGPGTFTNVLATEVYLQGFVNFELGLSSAVGMVMVAVMMVFGLLYFRYVALRNFSDIM
ncbi:carbohydrate ABC transporter permease [Martelella sp. AMO21009]